MQKEELIYLHTVLVQVKRMIEAKGITADFSDYEALQISPVHVHRSKTDHQQAIFVLSGEIMRAINNGKETPAMMLGKKDINKAALLHVKEKELAGLKASP